MIFDDIPRTDARPAGHAEGRFAFLNRSASRYFGSVRDLMEEWFSHVPAHAQAELRGSLRADDRQADAAFWELFLHEAYRRSDYDIEIHPALPGSTNHPDFRLSKGGAQFYLEAVSVGVPPANVAEDRRLRDVHQVLSDMQITNFSLELSIYSVGGRPLATRKLRASLRQWVDDLDPDEVAARAEVSSAVGFGRLPEHVWADDGWSLVLHALPLRTEVQHRPHSALGVMGPGEATIVDNVTGIGRVLEFKRSKYGQLDAPLVIAVLSNTEYPTHDYEVEQALYGVSAYRPTDGAAHPDSFFADGHWLTRRGWRNAGAPQVVTAYGLKPWTPTKTQPRLWQTLEPQVERPPQPGWLSRIEIGGQAIPLPAEPLATHFGLPDDWPGMAEPDFDLR